MHLQPPGVRTSRRLPSGAHRPPAPETGFPRRGGPRTPAALPLQGPRMQLREARPRPPRGCRAAAGRPAARGPGRREARAAGTWSARAPCRPAPARPGPRGRRPVRVHQGAGRSFPEPSGAGPRQSPNRGGAAGPRCCSPGVRGAGRCTGLGAPGPRGVPAAQTQEALQSGGGGPGPELGRPVSCATADRRGGPRVTTCPRTTRGSL